jgi:hypothetical protein
MLHDKEKGWEDLHWVVWPRTGAVVRWSEHGNVLQDFIKHGVLLVPERLLGTTE